MFRLKRGTKMLRLNCERIIILMEGGGADHVWSWKCCRVYRYSLAHSAPPHRAELLMMSFCEGDNLSPRTDVPCHRSLAYVEEVDSLDPRLLSIDFMKLSILDASIKPKHIDPVKKSIWVISLVNSVKKLKYKNTLWFLENHYNASTTIQYVNHSQNENAKSFGKI